MVPASALRVRRSRRLSFSLLIGVEFYVILFYVIFGVMGMDKLDFAPDDSAPAKVGRQA